MGPALSAIGSFVGAVFFGAAAGASAAYVLAVNITRLALLSLAAKAAAPKLDLTQAAADKLLTVRNSVQPQAFVYGQDMLSGPLLFANTSADGNKDLDRLVALTGREIESFEAFRIDDTDIVVGVGIPDDSDTVSAGIYDDVVDIDTRKGTSTQTAIAALTSAYPSLWTSSHRGRGWSLLFTKMTLEANNTAFESGIPQNLRALIKGHKVYDPRLDSTNGGSGAHRVDDDTTWEWSDNPALCLADWLMWERVGLGESSDRIDWELVIQAANVCDQLVPIPTASYQKRYTCNFTFFSDQQRGQIKEMLQDAMLGRCIESGGKWRMWAGAALLPDVKLTEANLLGSIQLQASTPSKERYNRVRGKFVDPSRNYAASAYPERRNSDYETADNGFKYKTIDFNTANTSFESQRGAEIRLRQSRQQKVLTWEGNWSCFRLQPGTVVLLDVNELEFADKKFFITEWKLRKDGDGVDLTLVEEDDTVWEDLTEADYTVRSPTGELIFAGQENLEVKLTGGNLHNSRNNATCSAGIRLNADGHVQYMTPAGQWTDANVPSGEWLGTGGRDYWVRCTVNSGTLDVGTTGSWLALDTDRIFNEVQATEGVDTANITLEIAADDAGAEVLTTAVFDISATYNVPPIISFAEAGAWYNNIIDGDTSVALDKPSYSAGDLLIVCMLASGGLDSETNPDESGTWTSLLSSGTQRRLWYRIATGDADDDFTITITSSVMVFAQMAAFDFDDSYSTISPHGNGTELSFESVDSEFEVIGIADNTDEVSLAIATYIKSNSEDYSPTGLTDNLDMTTVGTYWYAADLGGATGDHTLWAGWSVDYSTDARAIATAEQTEIPDTGTDNVSFVTSQIQRWKFEN